MSPSAGSWPMPWENLTGLDLNTLKQRAFQDAMARDKRGLRSFMRARRKAQDLRAAQQKSRRITQTLVSLPEYQKARCVALYSSLAEEVGTRELMQAALRQGQVIAVPKVNGSEIRLLRVCDLERDLVLPGSFGILEPDPALCEPVPMETVDLFVVPGLAFDRFGSRVGFGAGFYDRLLPGKRPGARVMAVAFDFQVVHAIQTHERDHPMEAVITEEEVYEPCGSLFRSRDELETQALAARLIQAGLGEGGVLALHAGLGVGKTVLVRGLAEAVHAPAAAASPTFVYCREYRGDNVLYHVDAYRLEAIPAGDASFWSEMLEQPGIVAVEWAERLGLLLPKSTIHLFADIMEDGAREWILWTARRDQRFLHKALRERI